MKANWWWKEERNAHLKWNRAAFEYELRMRAPKRTRKFKAWVELSDLERVQMEFEHRDESPVDLLFQRVIKPNKLGEKEREGFTPFQVMSWNLKLTDKSLAKGFLKWIHEWRQKAGIPKPTKNPNRKPTKMPRWAAIECIDRQDAGETLDDVDRSTVIEWRKYSKDIRPAQQPAHAVTLKINGNEFIGVHR